MRILWQATKDVLQVVLSICFVLGLTCLAWLYFAYHPSWLGYGIGVGLSIVFIIIVWALSLREANDEATRKESHGQGQNPTGS